MARNRHEEMYQIYPNLPVGSWGNLFENIKNT
jgi:hypothetical protein